MYVCMYVGRLLSSDKSEIHVTDRIHYDDKVSCPFLIQLSV